MIETGTTLQKRYRIESHIGQGGMGKVYVATDERFKSTVAIKETVFEDENLRKAFEREARLLNSLKHSALPRVSDHFNEKDGQFLVMEYISGEDLAEKMERAGTAFTLEEVLKWANQLCDALEYLHAQDIIHRDIKPQNLKVTPGGQIILLDFGLAKGNPTDAQHQTAAQSIFGYSRSYASLEQMQGTGTEPRSDLYSLSATLYHLLSGVPPVDALTRAMNVLNNQPDPLLSLDSINKNVPPEVAQVLKRAMALNASERPISAVSMRKLLEESTKDLKLSSNRAVHNYPNPNLLTQKTKLLSAETDMQNINQSQLNTKILTNNELIKNNYQPNSASNNSESKLTEVKLPIENGKVQKRGRIVGAGLFGGILLACSAFSALYLFTPNVLQTNSKTGNTNNTMQNNIQPALSNEDSANSNSVAANTFSVNNELNTNAQPKDTKPNITETAKKAKSQTKVSKENVKSNKANNDKDYMVIHEDSIETGGMIIDENGIRMKNQPPQPPNSARKPQIPPIEFKGLSPEQIRQLENLKNLKKRVIVVKTPVPQNTP